MNCTSTLRWSVFILLCATFLGGCSWFHHKENYYSNAAETRPLDVPPDLDTPVTSNELVVPATTTSATPAAAAPANAPPPTASVASLGATAATPATVLTGEGLHVADSPDHAWQRVGLALERAQVGTISGRDEKARSYTVEVSGLAAPQPAAPAEEHHWYTPILHPFGGGSGGKTASQPVSGHLTVRVSEDKDGARVSVEGDSTDTATATAAHRVLEALRERLS